MKSSSSEEARRKLRPLARPVWLPEGVWPFSSHSLRVDGANVAVTDVGRGPVLLFVHTGFWSFLWRDVILRLSGNFRCVCLDAPGTGQSERLPRHAITLDRVSRAVTQVIERLDLEDVTLVVHDLGDLRDSRARQGRPNEFAGSSP